MITDLDAQVHPAYNVVNPAPINTNADHQKMPESMPSVGRAAQIAKAKESKSLEQPRKEKVSFVKKQTTQELPDTELIAKSKLQGIAVKVDN